MKPDAHKLARRISREIAALRGWIDGRLLEMTQLNQEQINALDGRIRQVADTLGAQTSTVQNAVAGLRSDIDALKAQIPPEVDTSSLDANLAALEMAGGTLQAATNDLQQLDVENPQAPPPTPPEPGPEPGPEPEPPPTPTPGPPMEEPPA